jgi:hypothetical protein
MGKLFKLNFVFLPLSLFLICTHPQFSRRVRIPLSHKRVAVVPFGLLFNPYFLETYEDILSRGIKVETGSPDILFELRKAKVDGSEVLLINFVAKPIRVEDVKLDDEQIDVEPEEVSRNWGGYLGQRNMLAKQIFITGVSPEEEFDPYSILDMDEEELSIMAALLLAGWDGISVEGLPDPIKKVVKLMIDTLKITLELGLIDEEEIKRTCEGKEELAKFLEVLSQKLLEEGGDLEELGNTVKEKYLPWIRSKYGWVMYRTIYIKFIRHIAP